MSAVDEFDQANGDNLTSGFPGVESADLSCEVCGTPLVYGGRGRKPKFCDEHKKSGSKSGSASSPKRSTGNTERALLHMETLYDGLATVLAMSGNEASAGYLADKVAKVQEQNRLAFDSDPKLAQMVCRFGEKTGKGIFIAANVGLIVPVLGIARVEMTLKRNAKRGAEPEPEPESGPQRPYTAPQAAQPSAPAPQAQPGAPKPGNPLRDEVNTLRAVN